MKRLACFLLGHRPKALPWRAMSHPTWRWSRVIECGRCGKFIRREKTSAEGRPFDVMRIEGR